MSHYQKGKTNLDFTEEGDSEWQWHQLGHVQVSMSLQTDNNVSTPPLSLYRPDALPAAQPTASKLLLLLKSVELDDDVALLPSVAGLVVGPHVTSESEIGGTDSAAPGHRGPVFGFVEAV